MIRKGHMQSHQPSGITSRHSNAGQVQPQQSGVPMQPGPGFPALFQNVHRLHFIIAACAEHGYNAYNTLLGKMERPRHKIPQALAHPHAAVEKEHGRSSGFRPVAGGKKDIRHQLLSV